MNLMVLVSGLAAVVVIAGAIGWRQGRQLEERERLAGDGSAGVVGGAVAGEAAGSTARAGSAGQASAKSPLSEWAARLAAAGPDDLPAIAEEVLAVVSPLDRERWMRLLAARWAEVDPVGGATFFAERMKSAGALPGFGSLPRTYVLAEWAMRDAGAAWEYLGSLPAAYQGRGAADIGGELLRDNPEAFWDWYRRARVPSPGRGGMAPELAWLELARRHGAEMEAIAGELAAAPKNQDRTQDLYVIPQYEGLYALLATVKAESDPAAALAWTNSVPEGARAFCLHAILPLLAAVDPNAAREVFARMQSMAPLPGVVQPNVEQTVAAVVSEIAKSDLQAAVAWGAGADSNGYIISTAIANSMRSALADGRITPQAAFDLIREQKGHADLAPSVLRLMWDGLPADTLATVAAWLKTVDAGHSRSVAFMGLMGAWDKVNREAAMAFAHSLDDADLRSGVFADILSARTHFGTQSVRLPEVLASIPEADRASVITNHFRMHYSGAVYERVGVSDAITSQAFAEALVSATPGQPRTEAIGMVLGQWGAEDPKGAMEWVEHQPAGEWRTAAIMGAVSGWAEFDAWSVSEWVADQPRGPDRDAATHQLVRSLRGEEPDSAWVWAADITDPGTRLEARVAVLGRWRDLDPTAAGDAVAALTNLSPAERQKLADTLARKDGTP